MHFDLHCHTKEGSLDGKATLREYALLLKEKGYDGMLLPTIILIMPTAAIKR